MSSVLGGVAANGKLIIIGDSEEMIEVPTKLMLLGRRSIVGWPSGTSIDSQDTLSFSVFSGVRSMNEIFPLEKAAEAFDLARHDFEQSLQQEISYRRRNRPVCKDCCRTG